MGAGGARDDTAALLVGAPCAFGIGLGAVHVGPGGRVEHELRAVQLEGARHGLRIGDVELGASGRRGVATEEQRELAAELAAAAGHEHAGHASRSESVGLVVDQRSRTRSSSQRTFSSSGSDGSYSSVTW